MAPANRSRPPGHEAPRRPASGVVKSYRGPAFARIFAETASHARGACAPLERLAVDLVARGSDGAVVDRVRAVHAAFSSLAALCDEEDLTTARFVEAVQALIEIASDVHARPTGDVFTDAALRKARFHADDVMVAALMALRGADDALGR